MEVINIKEGCRPLQGEITTGGAKNAALPIIAATVLEPAEYTLRSVPRLKDVAVMVAVLTELGAKIKYNGSDMTIDTTGINCWEIPHYLMRKMRASILFMGPLLGRFGHVKISHPGGCSIGPRPIDWHLKGLKALGADFREKHGYIIGATKSFHGKEVHLDFPSVGATENIMLAAVRASGTTIIRNAAREPEIIDLQNFLNAMGGRIVGAGTDLIKIECRRHLQGVDHTIIPDRIEAGTFLVAAAITGGSIKVNNVIAHHLEATIAKLREAGYCVKEEGESLVLHTGKPPQAMDIKTLPYPGFPTDMQPQFMALLCLAEGTSLITETIFENRMKHAEELKRMGARIRVEGRTAIIQGVKKLYGALVESPPALRAGAALVLAGLAAEGETTITHIEHIERGYDNLVGKLASLGARIEKKEMPEDL